jgi:hypothetical protein
MFSEGQFSYYDENKVKASEEKQGKERWQIFSIEEHNGLNLGNPHDVG